MYELDPAKFLSAYGLPWPATLMTEKVLRGGICHSIYGYAKSNNKYMKDYNKNKESSYIQYWNVNNLYTRAMLQKPPVNNFEWIIDTS